MKSLKNTKDDTNTFPVRILKLFYQHIPLKGSVPSLSLFLININDIFKISENMSTIIFAYDTTILFKSKSFESRVGKNPGFI